MTNLHQTLYLLEDNYLLLLMTPSILYSIVFGFKMSNPREIAISELRYHVPFHALIEKDCSVFLVNNYDTHLPHSTWDEAHILDGPYETFSSRTFKSFLKLNVSETTEPTSNRRGRPSGNVSSISNKKTDEDADKKDLDKSEPIKEEGDK